MDTEKRMREILTVTGLYSGEDPFFSAELKAYGAGLRLLFEAIEIGRRNLFVQTAEEDMLDRFEKLFRVIPSVSDLETRRTMLLRRGAVMPNDFTRADLERQLEAAGIRGSIMEFYHDGLYINVHELLGISGERAEKEAKDFLPLHLPCIMDFGINSWAVIDARGLTFAEMDAATAAWAELDKI